MQKINTGLAGFGLGGQVFHAPFIHASYNFNLLKILERKSDKAQKIYPHIETAHSFDELTNDNRVDLIIISVPNTLHYQMAEQALKAGKHVVIDKPITSTSQEALKLTELAVEKNLVLSVFHNRRFDSDFLTVKRLVENEMLGRIVEYEAGFDSFSPSTTTGWRDKDEPAAGIVYDLGSHLIDQAVCLFGLPQQITADIRRQRNYSEADDYFNIALHYNNLRVCLRAGMFTREPSPHFVIKGINGSFVKYGMDVQADAVLAGKSPSDNDWGKEPPESWGTLNILHKNLHIRGKIESSRGNYSLYYDNIYEAITAGKELVVKPGEAVDIIRIIELAYQSSQTKQTVDFTH